MPSDCITYQDSGFFTPLIVDYLNQKETLKPFYNRFPSIGNFEAQILEKQNSFSKDKRQNLVEALHNQYSNIAASSLTSKNIASLSHKHTFTVTTGHQLNLFTGPLYFLYKIISAINLSRELQQAYPAYQFVPVYWMATEDHDFEEINFFNFKGKKFRWNRESSGAVGRLSTEGLENVFELFSMELGTSNNADEIRRLFKKAYLEHRDLTSATRWLANELFGIHGLVIIDGDDKTLKKEFAPFVKQELLQQSSFGVVSHTIKQLKGYTIQVNPREINLFYLDHGVRERIIKQDNLFYINNTDLKFTEDQILNLLETNPEKFSPNVILRPLYQEVILPNLCYIGGGGEIAYWLELKAFFEVAEVPFPVLLIRNSVLLATEKQAKKADALQLSWADLFLNSQELTNQKIKAFSEFPIDLTTQKQLLLQQFEYLQELTSKTDASFSGAVKAQQAKQIKGLENLEKRLLKAQKRKHADKLARLTQLQNELFPLGGLQERKVNFSETYLETGASIISSLLETLKPLSNRFDIIEY